MGNQASINSSASNVEFNINFENNNMDLKLDSIRYDIDSDSIGESYNSLKKLQISKNKEELNIKFEKYDSDNKIDIVNLIQSVQNLHRFPVSQVVPDDISSEADSDDSSAIDAWETQDGNIFDTDTTLSDHASTIRQQSSS